MPVDLERKSQEKFEKDTLRCRSGHTYDFQVGDRVGPYLEVHEVKGAVQDELTLSNSLIPRLRIKGHLKDWFVLSYNYEIAGHPSNRKSSASLIVKHTW
jgi:hypothetical protein